MRIIRASEIATYRYCRRAWSFHAQGAPSDNQRELAGGSAYHRRHGQAVLRAGLVRITGTFLLFVGLMALVVMAALWWVQ